MAAKLDTVRCVFALPAEDDRNAELGVVILSKYSLTSQNGSLEERYKSNGMRKSDM